MPFITFPREVKRLALPCRVKFLFLGATMLVTVGTLIALPSRSLAASGRRNVHVVSGGPNACESCHSFQRGAGQSQLSGNDQCFSCHTSPSGQVFPRAAFEMAAHGGAFSVKSRTSVVWPGRKAVDKGLCVNCHDPHGTGARALLRAGSAGDSSRLCLTCH
jgi:predicted CXXCH cytochrome family protein